MDRSFTLVRAHVGHVLAAAPFLREIHPDTVRGSMHVVCASHAWTIMAGREVLCIAGILPARGMAWSILLPTLLDHREAFTEAAFELLFTMRDALPGFPIPVVRAPREAREWLFEVARHFDARPLHEWSA